MSRYDASSFVKYFQSDLDSTNISDRSSPPIRIVVYCDDTLAYGSALSDFHYCASMDLSVHSI